jgi:hypothetical protein
MNIVETLILCVVYEMRGNQDGALTPYGSWLLELGDCVIDEAINKNGRIDWCDCVWCSWEADAIPPQENH